MIRPTECDFSNEDSTMENALSTKQEGHNQEQIQINEQEDSPTYGFKR